MRISVTPEHIRRGQRMRGQAWASANQAERECPIAHAIREHYPNARVSQLSIVPDGNLKGKYFLLPEKAQTFISEFDMSGKGQPFEFELA